MRGVEELKKLESFFRVIIFRCLKKFDINLMKIVFYVAYLICFMSLIAIVAMRFEVFVLIVGADVGQ